MNNEIKNKPNLARHLCGGTNPEQGQFQTRPLSKFFLFLTAPTHRNYRLYQPLEHRIYNNNMISQLFNITAIKDRGFASLFGGCQ
jgi:hypothetical protein